MKAYKIKVRWRTYAGFYKATFYATANTATLAIEAIKTAEPTVPWDGVYTLVVRGI